MAWIVVESEALVPADGLNCPGSCRDVESNLGGMNFEGEIDILFLEGVKLTKEFQLTLHRLPKRLSSPGSI